MIADELKEKLKTIEPDLITINDYWKTAQREEDFERITTLSNQEDFWKRPDQTNLLKELQHIKAQREQYLYLNKSFQEFRELIELFSSDDEELKKLTKDIDALSRTIKKFKIMLLLKDPEDSANCFFSINSGAGGTESQDWANMLLRMYVRFCEREGFDAKIIDYQSGEEAGIKSATLFIKGKNVYGLLKAEAGIHRLVRISPFDSNKRRHTSFAAVTVTPEAPEIEITIETKDLRIDTYRASGAGGQHVNKTESAVRITHIPTNIVVQCQNERSQIQNRETAMKMLQAKLFQKQKEEQEAHTAKTEKKKIEWGSQIRSYVLHPYKLVKDHRTDLESPQPDLILDGDLMEFIEGYLISIAR